LLYLYDAPSLFSTAKTVSKKAPEAGFKPDKLSGTLNTNIFILKTWNSRCSDSQVFLTENYIFLSVLQRLRKNA